MFGSSSAPRSGNSTASSINKKKSMLENASAQELSVLVLTIQDEYAKLSKDKAAADETIASLHLQYKDAMDEIGSLHTKVLELEEDNTEVRSTMDTLSSEFEKSAHEIASIESMKAESELALRNAEEQTQKMREALVSEIAKLTAELAKTKDELDDVIEEKACLESETNTLHQDLTLARRECERYRIEGKALGENTSKELQEMQKKFQMERNMVDQQKEEIDELQSELEGQKEDAEAAARSYEVAIDELKKRLEALQSDTTMDLEELSREREELMKKNEALEEEMEEVIERADRAEMTVSDFVVIGLL